ncbi:MAG: hypothetical protein FJZ01_16415, partial [Candidatus Sericytochromatia bacterium]|nr:hypothetical protein [Candidatus Tanganyikabacteria bacterium]
KAADDASKRLQELARDVVDGIDQATRPQPAEAKPEIAKTDQQPKDQPGFFKRLWEGTKNLAARAWGGIKWGLGKIWDGIKWIGEKTGITKALKWAWPKVVQGFTWFQQNLRWLLFGLKFEPFKTRKVVDDPGDVNFPDFNELQKAKKEIPARADAEKAALAKLSPEQQKQYEGLAKLTEKRPLSRWALQSMLLDGRLPGDKPLRGDGTLLDQLHRMATQDLAPGIKREDLLSDLIPEIENPVRINQQGKGTCVAATAQILIARKHPTEYARLIADLASPAGETVTVGGPKLKRAPDWADDSDAGRAIPCRLIQPALMDLGQPLPQPILDYDNTNDKAYIGPIPLGGGLLGWGSAEINTALQGRDYDSHMFFHWNRNSLWDKLKKAVEQGKGPIPIGMQWEDLGGHQVQIDKIENGTVHYTNPWGQRETMDEAEFKGYILNAEIPK